MLAGWLGRTRQAGFPCGAPLDVGPARADREVLRVLFYESDFHRFLFVKFTLWSIVMAIQRTFSIIKPDAVKKNVIGKIVSRFETNGLTVVASKMRHLSRREAEGFYAVHKERPFFGELVEGMTSGPTIVQVLEGENAILKNREIMGATNPANAEEGTIRKTHALSIGENSVHGSDAPETAAEEIKYWFSDTEIVG